MAQTRPNGVVVPINSDAYNPTADLATMADSANVLMPAVSATARNALPKHAGTGVIRTDTPDLRIDRYDGTNWYEGKGTAYTPIWTGVSDFGTGGSLTGTYWIIGDRVFVRSRAKFGTSATIGTAAIYCPLPTGYPIAGTEGGTLGTGFHVNTGGVLRPLVVFAGSSTTASVWSAQFPVQTLGTAGCTSASTEYIEISISYQTTVP
jgi:hypothetical protein